MRRDSLNDAIFTADDTEYPTRKPKPSVATPFVVTPTKTPGDGLNPWCNFGHDARKKIDASFKDPFEGSGYWYSLTYHKPTQPNLTQLNPS